MYGNNILNFFSSSSPFFTFFYFFFFDDDKCAVDPTVSFKFVGKYFKQLFFFFFFLKIFFFNLISSLLFYFILFLPYLSNNSGTNCVIWNNNYEYGADKGTCLHTHVDVCKYVKKRRCFKEMLCVLLTIIIMMVENLLLFFREGIVKLLGFLKKCNCCDGCGNIFANEISVNFSRMLKCKKKENDWLLWITFLNFFNEVCIRNMLNYASYM